MNKDSKIKRRIYLVYKNFLTRIFLATFSTINRLPRGKVATSDGLEKIWGITYTHIIGSQNLKFHIPNWLTEYRARTLLTKEPETIAWLNRMRIGSIFYDIGANIGLYSIYASAVKKSQVFAFEPSFLNLELLFRNIQSNQLQNKVTVIPLSLSATSQIENLFMQDGDNTWGGAHNSSGLNVTQNGEFMEHFSVSSQVASSLDELKELINLPFPHYVKIDVDGLEAMILKGGQKSLGSAREILIEVDPSNSTQMMDINNTLRSLGFVQEYSIDTIILTENQIWVKK